MFNNGNQYLDLQNVGVVDKVPPCFAVLIDAVVPQTWAHVHSFSCNTNQTSVWESKKTYEAHL